QSTPLLSFPASSSPFALQIGPAAAAAGRSASGFLRRLSDVGRFEPLARGRGQLMISTGREWLHRVASGHSRSGWALPPQLEKQPFAPDEWSTGLQAWIFPINPRNAAEARRRTGGVSR